MLKSVLKLETDEASEPITTRSKTDTKLSHRLDLRDRKNSIIKLGSTSGRNRSKKTRRHADDTQQLAQTSQKYIKGTAANSANRVCSNFFFLSTSLLST